MRLVNIYLLLSHLLSHLPEVFLTIILNQSIQNEAKVSKFSFCNVGIIASNVNNI